MPTITQLPVATAVNAGDEFVIVQNGTTKQATSSVVLAGISSTIQISESQVTNLLSDLAAKLARAANLADLTDASIARTNLGLGTAAVIDVPISATDGGTGVSDPTAFTLPIAAANSPFNFVGPLADGELLVGVTGSSPVAAGITAGTGISVVNTPGTITISSVGAGLNWTNVTGTSQSMSANNGYTANNVGLVTLTLPTTAAFGTALAVIGVAGSGGWEIVFNAGQSIQVGNVGATMTSGTVSSNDPTDVLYLICTVQDTVWSAISTIGNLVIT